MVGKNGKEVGQNRAAVGKLRLSVHVLVRAFGLLCEWVVRCWAWPVAVLGYSGALWHRLVMGVLVVGGWLSVVSWRFDGLC